MPLHHLFLLTLLLAGLSCAAHSFPAYRLMQSDAFGSMRTALDMPATNGRVVRLEDVDVTTLIEAKSDDYKLGLLILLPPALANNSHEVIESETIQKKWAIVEKYAISNVIDYPIYFAIEDETLGPLVGAESLSETGSGWRLVANAAPANPIKNAQTLNIQGWLSGRNDGEETIPSIAIVAHHDTFSSVPALGSGVRDNGSSVAAMMEIARIFSKLYSVTRSHGRYNLIFVLTGAGKQNYVGAKHWLENTDSRLVESIDMAICLDTLIGGGKDLKLHVSRAQKSDDQLFKVVESLKKAGQGIEFVHRKIDLSDDVVSWEHERFSRKHILAGTVSTRPIAMTPMERLNLLDRGALPDMTAIARNVKIVAELIGRVVYGSDYDICEGSLAVSEAHLKHWLSLLSTHPRPSHHTPVTAPILLTLQNGINEFVAAVPSQNVDIISDVVVYDQIETTMSLHHSQALMFDVILLPIVLTYLAILFVSLHGVSESVTGIKRTFWSVVRMVKKWFKK